MALRQGGARVQLVVPDGYTGLLAVIDCGARQVATGGESLVLKFEPNGCCYSEDAARLAEWHHIDAVYASGGPVPNLHSMDSMYLDNMPVAPVIVHWFYIGDANEAARRMRGPGAVGELREWIGVRLR
jgi:hypothetical protein